MALGAVENGEEFTETVLKAALYHFVLLAFCGSSMQVFFYRLGERFGFRETNFSH